MHGLMLRSLQGYVKDTFGTASWAAIIRDAAVPVDTFEPMLRYDPALVDRVADAAARQLDRPPEALWDDLGTYLVTNPSYEAVRRLLRFGGGTYTDFLHSLEDLPGRSRLALPELQVPDLLLEELAPDRFTLTCRFHVRAASLILLGMMRAMADDYGALILIDLTSGGCEDTISVHLLDVSHAQARPFALANPGA